MLNRITRWILAFQIYALDIEIEGQTEVLKTRLTPDLRRCIEASRMFARAERATLRSRHAATYPIGKRRIWDGA